MKSGLGCSGRGIETCWPWLTEIFKKRSIERIEENSFFIYDLYVTQSCTEKHRVSQSKILVKK
jgi:hypothetical protein